MTLLIELTPEQEARVNAVAQHNGVAPDEVLKKLVDEHLPAVTANNAEVDPTLALFAKWEEEDTLKSPQETAEENYLWETFEQGINDARRTQGMREL